jgi:hypothetical protein
MVEVVCRQNLEEGHFLQKETTYQSSVEWKVKRKDNNGRTLRGGIPIRS